MLPSITGYVGRSPSFKSELERLHGGNTRENPLIFPRSCAASLSFIVALVAAQSKKNRRIWAVADALPTQERVAAELPLWDTEGIFVPEREIHINNGLSDPDLAAERLEALRTITAATDKTRVIVVTAAALNQQAPVFSADSAAL